MAGYGSYFILSLSTFLDLPSYLRATWNLCIRECLIYHVVVCYGRDGIFPITQIVCKLLDIIVHVFLIFSFVIACIVSFIQLATEIHVHFMCERTLQHRNT